MLTPKSCDLFNIPFFQFSQLKKYQPESIPQIKADYKENWQVWQQLIQQVAAELGAPFAPPHIERDDLGKQDVVKCIVETVEDLLPLYEACHGK